MDAKRKLGEILSAFEFLDSNSMDLVNFLYWIWIQIFELKNLSFICITLFNCIRERFFKIRRFKISRTNISQKHDIGKENIVRNAGDC